MSGTYLDLCPNCGGKISAERLSAGAPCERCSPELTEEPERALERAGKLSGLGWLKALREEYERFSRFFESRSGMRPWGAQRSWAKRLLMLESFAIVAPTGVGKTTLLMIYAAYRASEGWRVLYLTPTENLARQVSERLSRMSEGVVAYYSSLPKKEREGAMRRIAEGSYKILVITTGFLERKLNALLPASPFNLIIVDDVDSLMRDSKNIERVLKLLGYSDETIAIASELVKAKVELYEARAAGRRDVEALEFKVGEIEGRLRRRLQREGGGQLIVASATGRPRGLRHLLFRELLDFEVGGSGDYLRNMIDSYLEAEAPEKEVVRLVKLLGMGGIVFVSQYIGKGAVARIVEALRREGIRAERALAGSWKSVYKLERGEIDVLVSVASRYGVVVRGLDAPRVVRYVIFVGAPAMKMGIEDALTGPLRLLRFLMHAKEEGSAEAGELARALSKIMERVDPRLLAKIVRSEEGGELKNEVLKIRSWAVRWARERISGELLIGTSLFVRDGDDIYVFVPDALTYIQASGRASRLLGGKMTLGLSVVLESRVGLVRALEGKLRIFADVAFKRLDSLDLAEVQRALDASRQGEGREFNVRSVLLVVESPTKARTIGWFWGRPGKRRVGKVTVYETSYLDGSSVMLLQVVATRGHIFELVEDLEGTRYGVEVSNGKIRPIYGTIKRCLSCGAQFISGPSCPRCGSSSVLDSRGVVDALRRLALIVDEVIIASDPDREGEKIAWDVLLSIKPYASTVRRARLFEITRGEIVRAIREAGEIDVKLVEAQMARRIADRWIGYALSGYLKKIYGEGSYGAGRVQSPVLGWVVRRYEEWVANRGYVVCMTLSVGRRICVFTEKREEADALSSLTSITVSAIERREERISPPPPLSTDAMVLEASRLGMSAEIAMRIAQELFESGLITYHRTDSIRVSSQGIEVARTYLSSAGLGDLFVPRRWSEEGAHEAIRPTRPLDLEGLERAVAEGSLKIPIWLSGRHRALYDLIFRRFMASQMREAVAIKARALLRIDTKEVEVEVVEKYLERGFASVYGAKEEPWISALLPGSEIEISESSVRRGSRVRLQTSGEIVRMMKEKGIGRPSTYHVAIEANKRHGYVIETKRARAIVPTKRGIEAYRALEQRFKPLIAEDYTKELEESLDKIERGEPADQFLKRLWRSISAMAEL